MSNHYSGVDLAFPHGDARLDYCDLFVFPKPGDANKTILILDVHPSFVVNPPGPTTTEPFSEDGLCEIMIDTNGDAVAELAYSIRFSGAPVSPGPDARITDGSGYRFFAGWRSDPFFFDAQGALNNLQFTGNDFFGDKNVCSIALEVPNAQLGSAKISLWGRTLDGASENGCRQTATRDHRRSHSSAGTTKRNTSQPCRHRTRSLFPRLRTRSSTPADSRTTTRCGLRRRCCLTC